MARSTIKQRISLDGGRELQEQLKALGAEGERAFAKIRKSAAAADLAKFGASLNRLGKDLATVGQRFAIAFAGLAAAGGAAGAAVLALAKDGAEAADASLKAAQAAGLQIDAYGRLSYAAEQAGTDASTFGGAMSKLNKALGDAAGGGKSALALFAQLGVKITDANGKLRPTEGIVQDLADAFAAMPDGAEKSARAIALFGKSGAALLPFLNSGGKGIRALGAEAEQLGIVFSEADGKVAESMNDMLSSTARAVDGIRNRIGLIFAPTITAAAERFRNSLVANRAALIGFAEAAAARALPIIEDIVSALAGDDAAVRNPWVLDWRDAIIAFGDSVKQAFSSVILPALDGLKKGLDVAAKALEQFTGISIDGAALGIVIAVGTVTGAFRALGSAINVVVAAFTLARAHPIVAALSVVAGGIAWWATRTDEATAAMQRHQGIVDSVKEAYARAGGEVAKMTQEVRDRLLLETRDALKKSVAAFEAASADMRTFLQKALVLSGDEPNPFREIMQAFIDGKVDAEAFNKEVARIAVLNPEFDLAAQKILKMADGVRTLGSNIVQGRDYMDLLTGKISDAEFQSRQAAGAMGEFSQAAGKAAAPLDAVGKSAQAATAEVQQLGKQITVTRFGEAGMTKETFNVVDGIAQRAEQSKATLDGLGQAATGAGRSLEGVSNEITNSIEGVPPAAEKVASDANAALAEIGDFDNSDLASALVAPFDDASAQIDGIMGAIKALAVSGFEAVASEVRRIGALINAEIAKILAALRAAAAAAASLRSSTSSSGGGSDPEGFASGGYFRGKGGPRSDSNLAWISNGEYIVNALATARYRPLLEAINGMRVSGARMRDLVNGFPAFSVGGLMSGLEASMSSVCVPRFAEGGLALAPAAGSSGRPISLSLDGQTFEMVAPDDVAEKLVKAITGRSLRAAGRKPSWMGA